MLSDLDVGIAVRDDDWEAVAGELPDRLRRIAVTVDLLAHAMPEWGDRPHRRLFVQYADGRQIDLVVRPAGAVIGRVPGAVVLYDPDGLLAEERFVAVARATHDDSRRLVASTGGPRMLPRPSDRHAARSTALVEVGATELLTGRPRVLPRA